MGVPPVSRCSSMELDDKSMLVECCISCLARYDLKLTADVTVTVLCRRPSDSKVYKAISYFWKPSETFNAYLKCLNYKAHKYMLTWSCVKLRRTLIFISSRNI